MDNHTGSPKILIVDDIPENLFALEAILKKLDAQVIKAGSGNEALIQVLDHDFALIILDVQMPEMDGYEVAEILKSDETTENIPIIFVTAVDRDDTKELKGYGTGAVDFIFKPLNEFILLSKVKVFLESYRIKSGLEDLVAQRTKDLSEANRELKEQIEHNIEASRELEKSKAYLSNVINAISSCLISVDEQGKIVDLNQEAQKVSGVSMPDAVDKHLSEIFPFSGELINDVEKALASRTPAERSHVSVYKDGKLFIKNFAIYPIRFYESKGAVIRVDDVTEQVKLDEIMIQSEKMLSIGGLATGMAQEINGPLAGIIQNSQVIKNRFKEDIEANTTAARECGTTLDAITCYMETRGVFHLMDSMLASGVQAAHIVENMLSFTRKSEGLTKNEDLAEVLEKTLALAENDDHLQHQYDFGAILIEKSFQPDMPQVPCQANKIQQVLLNILKNGAQAMAELKGLGETVRKFAITLRITPDNHAEITIRDNGPGMTQDLAKKIFDPFFTTRKYGAGLGLAISYYIIHDDHNGALTVETAPGKGACFIMTLPLQ
ncbi:MAG: response regulator [Desulfobacterales bacterium]|nr:response regulator [Desulfobacterales bacterium]